MPKVRKAQKSRKAPVRRLYSIRNRDGWWVGEDGDGSLWEFPMTNGGWSERQPYTGSKHILVEADPAEARGTSWRGGAGRGRRRLGGASHAEAKVMRASPEVWHRANKAAEAKHIPLSEYVRRALDAQLQLDRA